MTIIATATETMTSASTFVLADRKNDTNRITMNGALKSTVS